MLGGAKPRVGRVLGLAHVARHADGVAALAVLDGLVDEIGLAFEGARERVVVVLLARDLLEHDAGCGSARCLSSAAAVPRSS